MKFRAADTHGGNDEWYTPREIVKHLGPFDLDPCTSTRRPWDTASEHYEAEKLNGLRQQWKGRVWLNPPYSKARLWMEKMSEHGNGIALVYARTGTIWFHEHVFASASAILFLRGRVSFYQSDGSVPRDAKGHKTTSGAPSCLVAYDPPDMRENRIRLQASVGSLEKGGCFVIPGKTQRRK